MNNHNQESNYEEPEGLNDAFGDVEEEYPIDSVLIRTDNRTVYEIIRRIKQGNFILDPDFQRDFVWDEKKQSRLIESMLMRIPLPVFYLAETDNGNIVVVDGLQRLTTFNRYLNNEFALKGLEKTSPSHEGKMFDDLIPKLQNRLEDTQLTLYIIDSKVPERAKLDIFERVNGGVPLTRQQMRNCLFMGPATKWLKQQAKSEPFLTATTRSLNPKTMRDRELINRFCGFYLLGTDYYRGDMDAFLAKTLKHMNQMTEVELDELGQKFQMSMQNNYTIFEKHAFRKHTTFNKRRSVINAALFDVFSVLMTRYENEFAQNNTKQMQNLFFGLMNNEVFYSSITSGTNDTRRVKNRFGEAEKVFQEL